MELWWFGKYVTRRDELMHKYKQHADVVERSGQNIVQDMAREIKNMMDLKISAVKVSKVEVVPYFHIFITNFTNKLANF
jgi:hypothetical protein